jgi:hypothetical protein
MEFEGQNRAIFHHVHVGQTQEQWYWSNLVRMSSSLVPYCIFKGVHKMPKQ